MYIKLYYCTWRLHSDSDTDMAVIIIKRNAQHFKLMVFLSFLYKKVIGSMNFWYLVTQDILSKTALYVSLNNDYWLPFYI